MKSVVNQNRTISNDDTNSQITKKKQLVFFVNIFCIISVGQAKKILGIIVQYCWSTNCTIHYPKIYGCMINFSHIFLSCYYFFHVVMFPS